MTPIELIDAARKLLDDPVDCTGGVWGRAATFLARQALEQGMAAILEMRAPGSQQATFTAQLLVLGEVLEDRELAKRTSFTWSALSGASHVHGYELSPTATELREWIAAVQELLEEIRRRGHPRSMRSGG